MALWTVNQWASLISILVVAVTAIVFCAKLSYRVDDLKERYAKLEESTQKHHSDHSLHRGPDFERWLSGRLDDFDEKLDDIRDSIKQKS